MLHHLAHREHGHAAQALLEHLQREAHVAVPVFPRAIQHGVGMLGVEGRLLGVKVVTRGEALLLLEVPLEVGVPQGCSARVQGR